VVTIEKSGLRRVLILADESANWEVAGLRQLDRLALALNEVVLHRSPNERIAVVVRWDSNRADRWLPQHDRLTAIEIQDGSEAPADRPDDLVLDTHMFPFRKSLGGLMEQTGLTEQIWTENFGCYLHSPDEISNCERTYLRRGGKSQDGLVSRFLNRPISRALSRQLLKFQITPSGWTLFILIFPVIGSLLLVRGTYTAIVWGVILFHLYSVLDGCDGEIARAKFLESDKGRRLDGLCDIATNLLLAIALGIGLSGYFILEGMIVATLIATNEWFLAARHSLATETATIPANGAIYPRHQALWNESGIGILGERFTSWLVQLTKRDFAMLGFVVLALIGQPAWILHLLGATAAISLGLAVKAMQAPNR
jgi:phosphatidylglycerophosphate synthase